MACLLKLRSDWSNWSTEAEFHALFASDQTSKTNENTQVEFDGSVTTDNWKVIEVTEVQRRNFIVCLLTIFKNDQASPVAPAPFGSCHFFIIIHVIIYVEYPTKLLKKTN